MVVREVPGAAYRLAEAFWPGPLTLILPRSKTVADSVCAGLDTASVRMPSHPVALAVIRAAGVPLAAPSANLSGSPSPTTAADVLADMEGKIPLILDGGAWKDWLTPLLGFVDIAVVSEDFAPPLMARPDGAQVAEFLRGFGITRTVRTRGDRSVQYWWDGTSGEVPIEAVPDASTLGAGDAFHGAFAWAIERGGDADPERLIRFASAVAAVSVSSFGTRQWLASPSLAELVRGW